MTSVSKINLSNLKKCNQAWENMAKNEKGRLCLKCNNTIIDFRKMTDAEVAETHLFSTQKVCGLYNKEQLKKPKKTSKKNRLNRLNSLYVGLFGLLSFNATAQENAKAIKTEQTEVAFDPIEYQIKRAIKEKGAVKRDSIVITGKLTDKSNIPFPFANVIVKGTKIGTTSNIDGYYSLDITKALDTLDELTITYSFVGYKPIEVIIDTESLANEDNRIVNMQFDEGEVISFYVYERVPLHKKIWYKMKGIFNRKN